MDIANDGAVAGTRRAECILRCAFSSAGKLATARIVRCATPASMTNGFALLTQPLQAWTANVRHRNHVRARSLGSRVARKMASPHESGIFTEIRQLVPSLPHSYRRLTLQPIGHLFFALHCLRRTLGFLRRFARSAIACRETLAIGSRVRAGNGTSSNLGRSLGFFARTASLHASPSGAGRSTFVFIQVNWLLENGHLEAWHFDRMQDV
jgi:hypothetical protein